MECRQSAEVRGSWNLDVSEVTNTLTQETRITGDRAIREAVYHTEETKQSGREQSMCGADDQMCCRCVRLQPAGKPRQASAEQN